MNIFRKSSLTAAATAALLALGPWTSPAGAAQPSVGSAGSASAVLTGLSSNKAVTTSWTGDILLGTAAEDGTGLLQKYVRYGRRAGSLVTLATLPASPSDIAPAGFRDVWVLFGAEEPPGEGDDSAPTAVAAPGGYGNKLYKWDASSGELKEVADLGAYAQANLDPYDQEGNPGESNAYGLAGLFDGSVLVADAAANAVRRVWPDGTIKTVVRLATEAVRTDHLPPNADPTQPAPPPTIDAEAVPTSVAQGLDGYWYVGELKGFPFRPGSSRVWRIKPGTVDGTCDPAAPDQGACRTYAADLTSIIDITPDLRGNLDVLEIAKDGVGVLEAAAGGGSGQSDLPPAALIQISRSGDRTELAPGQIFIAGGVTPDWLSRSVFVTDFQLVAGQGRLLKVG